MNVYLHINSHTNFIPNKNKKHPWLFAIPGVHQTTDYRAVTGTIRPFTSSAHKHVIA